MLGSIRTGRGFLFLGCMLAITACGGRAEAPSSRAADGAGGGNGIGSGGSAGASPADSCSTVPSATELAETPRENTNLELLALKFSRSIVADQGVYNSLVRDVGLIKARDPGVSDIQYFPHDDGKGLLLTADAATIEQMQAGTYTAWNCLNDAYGVQSANFNLGLVPFAELELEGIYNIRRVAQQYGGLPGIKSAMPNMGGGDGSTICVVEQNEITHYVFDRAGGDCPAGCTEHEYKHFTVTAGGGVSELGALSAADEEIYASSEACD